MFQWGSDIDDEVQEPKAVWYRRRRLWTIWVPMFLILACIGSGILIYELNPVKVYTHKHNCGRLTVVDYYCR